MSKTIRYHNHKSGSSDLIIVVFPVVKNSTMHIGPWVVNGNSSDGEKGSPNSFVDARTRSIEVLI